MDNEKNSKEKSLICILMFIFLFLSSITKAECIKTQNIEITPVNKTYLLINGCLGRDDGRFVINYLQGAGRGYSLLRLNFSGWNQEQALIIGYYIRSHGISTWTDGKDDICIDSCNRVFIAGVKRIYSNAENIETGKNEKRKNGLSFGLLGSNMKFDDQYYQQIILPYVQTMLPIKGYSWFYDTEKNNKTTSLILVGSKDSFRFGIATDK
jgi:hypothetical protein